MDTDDFIDDTLVGVEVKGEAWVAGRGDFRLDRS